MKTQVFRFSREQLHRKHRELKRDDQVVSLTTTLSGKRAPRLPEKRVGLLDDYHELSHLSDEVFDDIVHAHRDTDHRLPDHQSVRNQQLRHGGVHNFLALVGRKDSGSAVGPFAQRDPLFDVVALQRVDCVLHTERGSGDETQRVVAW